MYGYKSVKWLARIQVEGRRHVGFWERRGWQLDPYV
jgi:DMSO/TMAO reductase YedYZ molybdopterin-dependent catalytic subunit